ncbi:hypothetical protein BGW39_002453 [Mortierella sp. 14UC]|nr:hypothetical protein BGW39_002453 [Mortierella sp. 14UC]
MIQDFKFKCVVADPTFTTLYAFTYAYSSEEVAKKKGDEDVIAILKSNENPSDITTTDFTVVATISAKSTLTASIPLKDTSFACAVNGAGVFNAVISNVYTPRIVNAESHFQGIRYNPVGQTAAEHNATGGGAWSTIDIAPNYNLSDVTNLEDHRLFYTGEAGKETLVHAFAALAGAQNASTPVIQLGDVVDSGSRPLLQLTKTYKNDTLLSDPVTSLAYGNNKLFAYAAGPESKLFSIDLADRASASAPAIKRFNSSFAPDCTNSVYQGHMTATWKDSYFLFCYMNNHKKNYLQLSSIESTLNETRYPPVAGITDNEDTLGVSGKIDMGDLTSSPFFQPIGGNLPGQIPFAVFNNEFGYQGIRLQVNITDMHLDGKTVVISEPELVSPGSSGLSAGAWVGVAVGVVVVAIASVFSVRRYRQKRNRDAQPDNMS